eukprot:scaffold64168_cov78-Attheya_sp.AAC.2
MKLEPPRKPPKFVLREVVEEDDNRGPFFTRLVDCKVYQISNDPFKSAQKQQCISTLATCSLFASDPVALVEDLTELPLEFDYELYLGSAISDENKQSTALLQLESMILKDLANKLRLLGCSNKNLLRRLEDNSFPGVTALASLPIDEVDTQKTTCSLSAGSVAEYGSCVTMKGGMTAYLEPGTDPTPIKSGLVRFVRDGMDQDTYVDGTDIVKIVYVGKSTTPPSGNNRGVSTSTNEAISSTATGAIIAAAAVVGLIISLFLYQRKKRRQKEIEWEVRGMPLAESNSFDDDELMVLGAPPIAQKRRKTKNVVHGEESVEGADVHGSLAATDALALLTANTDVSEQKEEEDVHSDYSDGIELYYNYRMSMPSIREEDNVSEVGGTPLSLQAEGFI